VVKPPTARSVRATAKAGQRWMGAQEEELQRVVCGLGRSGRRLDRDPLLPVAT
jgi:hypothetical protein